MGQPSGDKRCTGLELSCLPNNDFEVLRRDRQGQFSIRINEQWRICFEWPDGAARPFNIEIVDYH
jgi:proteic killer suppression protein